MTKLKKFLTVAAGVGSLALASQAHAVALFTIEANPSNKDEIKLSEGDKITADAASDDGVGVNLTAAGGGTDHYSSGDATIKPDKDSHLTMLTIDPANDTKFDDFSFRGQDLVAGSTIKIEVFDQNGVETDFTDVVPKANQDFDRFGIIGAPGETISKVILINDDGFKEVKQMALSLAPLAGAVPEPATWMMMILGLGMLGTGLRIARDRKFLPQIAE